MQDVLLRYNLQFFAEGEGGEKTEEATPKKLDNARDEGQVAKSKDLVTGVTLLILFLVIKIFSGYLGDGFINSFSEMYGYISKYGEGNFTNATAFSIVNRTYVITILIALPFLLGAFISALVMDILQVKWKITTKPLQPKFDKINPLKGFKRIINKDKIVELVKAILKIIIIMVVVYNTLSDQWGLIMTLYDYSIWECLVIIGDVVVGLGIKISMLLLIIGIADYIYQKLKFRKEMMMSKQEIKDESKQSEGDPQIKGKIRRKMQEASMRRMMQELPKADVVITNPTHFAVAIKYDKEVSAAPVVIAKGADHLAQRIKDVARENDIEIYEDKPLARMLYFNVDIGSQIPAELYQMVAEVLAYVYKLKNKI